MSQRRTDLRLSGDAASFELDAGEAAFLREALRGRLVAPDQVRALLLLCEASAREGRPLDPRALLLERFVAPEQRAALAAQLAASGGGPPGPASASPAAVQRARAEHARGVLTPAAARAWATLGAGVGVPPTLSGSRVLGPPPSSSAGSRRGGSERRGPATSASRDPLPARIGDYPIERELGRGGMGVVYLARDPGLERQVAIKVCSGLSDLDPVRRERRDARFRREAQAVARLRHPGIVSVYACGVHEGTPYLVMDYVPGETLQSVGQRGVRPEQAAAWARELAEALAHAHAQGILHRDVKPENVMVDPRGHVHLMDFGLAYDALDDSGLTGTGALLGTAFYVAPEQAAGEPVDPRADVYGVGGVLYFLLARRPPYSGNSLLQFLQELATRPPDPLREVAPGAPAHLVAVVERCMQRDPERRFASAAALAEALRGGHRPAPSARSAAPVWIGAGLCLLALATSVTALALSRRAPSTEAQAPLPAAAPFAWERYADLEVEADPELAAELEDAVTRAGQAAQRQGASLLERHHPDASRRLWEAILSAAPADPQAIWRLHRLDVLEDGETHRATPGLERLRQSAREQLRAFERALAAEHAGDLEDARARYAEALAVAPELGWLPALNLAERAAYAALSRATTANVEGERALFATQAQEALTAGLPARLASRLEAWRRLLAQDLSGALEALEGSHGSWAQLCRGWAHYYRTELEAAERAAEASLAADPALYEAHDFMSMLDSRRGRAAAALTHLERMIALRGVEPRTLLNRAALRAIVGDLAGCVADCQEILRQDPRNGVARLNLGKALHGQGRDEDAAAHLDALVDLLGGQEGAFAAQAFYERSGVREALGDRAAALEDLRQARARDPYGRLVPLIDQALARLGAPR
ncbi:MAG: protein kinase [Planctomycetota bacterium]